MLFERILLHLAVSLQTSDSTHGIVLFPVQMKLTWRLLSHFVVRYTVEDSLIVGKRNLHMAKHAEGVEPRSLTEVYAYASVDVQVDVSTSNLSVDW